MHAEFRYIPESSDGPHIYSVSEITKIIKELLGDNFSDIVVEGEISNFTRATSGHLYFSLKDANSTLRCVMWRGAAQALKFAPEPGMKVQAFGSIDVYAPRGEYQLQARRLRPLGAGELEIAFRQLYARLDKEGVFAEERKRPLPAYPFTVGIVTSPTGAAIRDIINVFRRRNHLIKLIIYPSQVQGEGSEDQIAAGLDYLNTREDIDLIITGRGGGSLEDLWAFNTETVVRAILRSRIPVIAGVGHEVDWTLADYTADYRAPTPSAAAEIAAWERAAAVDSLTETSEELAANLEGMLEEAQAELDQIVTRGVFANPFEIVTQRSQTLDILTHRFAQAARSSYREKDNALALRLQRLDSLSPLKTLARGYSVTRAVRSAHLKPGAVVRDATALAAGETVEVIARTGRFNATVDEVFAESFEETID